MPEKTEAQKRAQRKYMSGRATVQIVMSTEDRDALHAAADAAGVPMAEFIRSAIVDYMAKAGE